MTTASLQRVLVLSRREELPQFLRICLGHFWPRVKVDAYPTAYGPPPADFDWNPYQFIFVEQHDNDAAEANLIKTLRQQRPDLRMVSLHANGEPGPERSRANGTDQLCFLDLSPRMLADYVQGILDPERRGRTQGTRGSRSGSRSGVADPELALGARVPGYEVIRKLADGGMASIFLATRAEDKRQVVLKILRLQDDGNDELLKRFMREYELIGKLEHANVLRIFERGFAQDFAYIAMEHCPAGDLKSAMERGLDAPRALGFVRQIASGLGAVHALGIVHRDLKPSNVLFKDADNLAIADFGIAKDLTNLNVLTVPGSMLGTPYYASPEQLEEAEVDHRSDLYSLGVILFYLLTGRRPFEGNTLVDLIHAHRNSSVPQLPIELHRYQAILDGLLAKDPDERFQSAAETLAGIDWVERES